MLDCPVKPDNDKGVVLDNDREVALVNDKENMIAHKIIVGCHSLA